MLNFERQTEILELLSQEKCLTVEYLSQKLFASGATIRRDLTAMEKRGQLTRIHGGAALNTGSNTEAPLLLRTKKEQEKKRKIAELALPLLAEQKTVFMDSSSTVAALAFLLTEYAGLSIVTNGILTAETLNERTNNSVYLTGGLLSNNYSLVGKAALDMISKTSADILFFSCCGFTTSGTWEAGEENALIKIALGKNARKIVLLCDSTKFSNSFFWSAVPLSKIDLIVTDTKPESDIIDACGDKLLYK